MSRIWSTILVFLVSCLLGAWSVTLLAQPPTAAPGARLTWEQDGANAVEVAAYVYRYYPDGATTGIPLADVVCAFTVSTFTCAAAFPAFTPAPHTLTLTAGNEAGESLASTPFPFVFVVLPSQPKNLRITR